MRVAAGLRVRASEGVRAFRDRIISGSASGVQDYVSSRNFVVQDSAFRAIYVFGFPMSKLCTNVVEVTFSIRCVSTIATIYDVIPIRVFRRVSSFSIRLVTMRLSRKLSCDSSVVIVIGFECD